MQHVLITGATGFLGSHLLEALLSQGYEVSILKRSTSDTWRIDHLVDQVSSYNIDQVTIEKAFKPKKVNAVIHTACTYGRHGESAHEVVKTNLLFGLEVLDAATLFNTDTFFNTDTLLPKYLNAYSLSKKQFSEWLKQRSTEIKVVNLKLEHMYGPRDDQTKLVPWIIGQLEQGVDRISLTEGDQKRDFIYIDDVVSAYTLALQKADQLNEYTEFDVGTGQLTSVREFVAAIYENYQKLNPTNTTELGFGDIPMRNGEMMTVDVDNNALKEIGWCVKTEQSENMKKLFKDSK
jgi:nucleoside-diphosphate-sugar epimerase